MKKYKKFVNNFYNWYLAVLSILVTLPVLAPVLLKLGLEVPAKAIYFVYSFFCHQFATRSIHIFDYQYAWCARDTGIWLGVAAIAWLLKFNKVKPIKWYWVIPFVIPIALDGGLQTIFTMLNITRTGGLESIPVYASNDLIRFLTGSFFGVGLSLWISGTFIQDLIGKTEEKTEKLTLNLKQLIKASQAKIIFLTMAVLLLIYLTMIAVWTITSSAIMPTDFADSAVKLQNMSLFERRADAVCATKGVEDVFSVSCFFNK